jgi:aryl-alcohol dehydrogenase-like predicted oxidoreductase
MNRVKRQRELELSRIVYGMWRLGDDATPRPPMCRRRSRPALRRASPPWTRPISTAITGPRRFWVRRSGRRPGLRDRVELVTKCDIVAPIGKHSGARVKHYDTSRTYITGCVEQLAERDGDGPDRPSADPPARPPDGSRGDGPRARCAGRLGQGARGRRVEFPALGLELLQSAMETPLVTNQIELSAMHLDPFTNGDIAFHQERGHPVMAWSPLAGGRLFTEEGAAVREVLTRIGHEQGWTPARWRWRSSCGIRRRSCR